MEALVSMIEKDYVNSSKAHAILQQDFKLKKEKNF